MTGTFAKQGSTSLVSVARSLAAAATGVAVLGIGAVHDATSAVVEILLWFAGLAWFSFRGRHHLPGPFVAAAVLLLAFLTLQLIPLPPSVLAALSPATREFHRNTVELVEEISFGDAPAANGELVALASTARAARESALPASWRTPSVSPYTGRRDVLRYLAYGIVLWIAATISCPTSLLGLVIVLAVSASALGLAQMTSGTGLVLWIFESFEGGLLRGDRARGTFVNPDHFALLLAMSIPAGLGWLARRLQGRPRRRHGGLPLATLAIASGIMILVAGLIASASRGGVVGAMLGAVALWWGARRRLVVSRQSSVAERIEIHVKRAAPYLVAIAIVAFGFGLAGPDAGERLDARVAQAMESPDFDLGRRPMMLSATLPMIADFPLVGFGAGGWRHVVPRYQWGALLGRPRNHAHNDYVEWLAETGAAGTFLTVLLVVAYARWARANPHVPTAVRWGLVGSITAVGWHEAVDFGLRVPANAMILAILLGLLCNPYWRGRRVAQAPRYERQPGAIMIAAVAVVCLTMLSASQIREALAWGRVRAGEPRLSFAASDADTWNLLGDRLVATGRGTSRAAREAYLTAAALQPVVGSTYWSLLPYAPSLEDRLRAARAAVYTNPGYVPWRVGYAALLDTRGRPDLALRELEGAIARDPRASSHTWVFRSGGELAPALIAAIRRGLERAMSEHPDDEGIASDVALLEQKLGRSERAAQIWLRLADESGDWGRYGHSAGLSLAKEGLRDRAEEIFRRVIREAPGAPESYRSLALFVLEPTGRVNEAEKILERGLRRAHDRKQLYLALSVLRERRGDVDGALAARAEAAEWRPRDFKLHVRLANAYLQKGDFHRAKIAYDRALELRPDHAGLHFMSGRALEKLYDLERARRAYSRAVELAPSNPQYRRALTRIEVSRRKGEG